MEWGHHLCLETISNNLRYKILMLLKTKSKNVSEISKELKVERSNVSHALEMLKKCSIVDSRKEGKQMIYNLKETPLMHEKKGDSIFKIIEDHKKEFCKECYKVI